MSIDHTRTAGGVTSADGTRIALHRSGTGPAVVLVDGALCYSGMGPGDALASCLAKHFRVYQYDRRGRGLSADSNRYAVQRELEDLDAVVEAAGGSVCLWGMSSGALLALKYAAVHPEKIRKVSVYEAPCIVEGGHEPTQKDWGQIAEAVSRGSSGTAVRTFLKSIGLPRLAVAVMPILPFWSKLKAVAHTLPYDGAIVERYQRGQPLDGSEWEALTTLAQVVIGGKSPPWMQNGNRALCAALPSAHCVVLEGQTHDLKPTALAPLLVRFFEPHAQTT
ncbi:alpha/beta hydrolase [Ramlibacter sp.]|uniref:alpha/beta fold hydrolase n=1 Tax=Ramlibacter sp. TaxID=1917967 RepID=UPI002621098A|nr:alpha/beta hydrolase [Ramlibacter sp.]MDB5954594.1 putative hydrolase [Ramlibacter sp.]